jgi:LmbE family N-acetylglucosaminyl deacetylase
MSRPVVLSLMAHPDDAEFLCGGTLLLLAERGWEVHVASMTPGDCGTSTLSPEEVARVRREEGRRGARALGGAYHCLEERDLQVHYEREANRKACGLLREVRPRLVITHSPSDYMIDHEETSRVARAACFNAPVPNAPAPPRSKPLEAIPHLYYADPVEGIDPLGNLLRPSVLVDVTAVIERKAQALAEHASQREWLRAQHGIDEYLESMRKWSRERGALLGLQYAEGFRQHLGHPYPRDDLLAAVLAENVHRL